MREAEGHHTQPQGPLRNARLRGASRSEGLLRGRGGPVEEEGEESVKKSKPAREAPENSERLPQPVALVDLPPPHTVR